MTVRVSVCVCKKDAEKVCVAIFSRRTDFWCLSLRRYAVIEFVCCIMCLDKFY